MKAIGLPFVCLAMFAVAGGHWAVLQSVAWTQMVWDYSQQEGSVFAGAQKTFSGKAPCSMCKNIAAAKQKEEKAPATLKVDKKAEIFLVAFGGVVPLPSAKPRVFHTVHDDFFTRTEAPPAPVPIV